MNFAEILEPRFRYGFTDAICYVSVRSIEYEYNRLHQDATPKPYGLMFTSWLQDEKDHGYTGIAATYNFVMLNPRGQFGIDRRERAAQIAATTITAKITTLIHSDPSTNAIFLHPMLAIMFAISLSREFAVEVIGHINGLRVAGCEAESTPLGNLWEAIDDRNLTIADYQKSLVECESLVNESRDNLRDANRANAKLETENEHLTILLEAARAPRKSIMIRICEGLSRLGRSNHVYPINTERDRHCFQTLQNEHTVR